MRKQKMIPLSYKVLIKDESVENKTAGGIILGADLTNAAQAGSVYGEVIAMGVCAFKPREVTYINGNELPVVDDFGGHSPEEGSRVAYVRNAGTRYVKIGGEYRPINEDYSTDNAEYYRVLNDIDIIAIVEKAK